MDTISEHTPDALVIYTSDHGDMLHSHSLSGKGSVMYEEITNIPFIIRWPGVTPEGSVCNSPVSHIDIVPTIMIAADLSVPKLLEGKTLTNTLSNPHM